MSARRVALRLALTVGALMLARLLAAGAAETSGEAVPLGSGAGSALWIEGTSNVHDWQSKTTQTQVSLTLRPGVAWPADPSSLESLMRSAGVHAVDVEVPARSLHSEKSGLDKNLWKHIKAEAHPAIRFRLDEYTVAPASSSGDTMAIRAVGVLTVAGVPRPDTLEARAWRATQGVWLEGSEPLLMSDFGIRPPTMMLGALRVKDRVVVHYKLLLLPTSDAGNAPAGSN